MTAETKIRHLTTRWHNNDRAVFLTDDFHAIIEIQFPKDESDLAFIWHLWVDEGYRRKGYAAALLDAAEQHILLQGKSKAALEWDSRDTPVEIFRWYERRGYRDSEFGPFTHLLVKELS